MTFYGASRDLGNEILLARLREGDEAALDTLLRRYGVPLIRYATKIVRSEDSAQDVVQEVFLQLWRNRSHVEVQWDIVAYLYGMTRKRAMNFVRSERTTSRREDSWATQEYGQAHIMLENDGMNERSIMMRADVWEALTGVSPRCREVFMLVWDHQWPYKKIAKLLGIAEPTVRNYVSLAVKRVVSALGERYRTDGLDG